MNNNILFQLYKHCQDIIKQNSNNVTKEEQHKLNIWQSNMLWRCI